MSRAGGKTLAERLKDPKVQAEIRRHSAKLTAQDEYGWAVMEPKRARALEAVARAAEHLVNEDRNRKPGEIHCTWVEACDRTTRALARLRRAALSRAGEGAK